MQPTVLGSWSGTEHNRPARVRSRRALKPRSKRGVYAASGGSGGGGSSASVGVGVGVGVGGSRCSGSASSNSMLLVGRPLNKRPRCSSVGTASTQVFGDDRLQSHFLWTRCYDSLQLLLRYAGDELLERGIWSSLPDD